MADYAISNVDRRIVYTGSAGVGPYAFNFEVLDQTDIAVYKNTTLLVLTTNYTVSINPSTGVGSVTLNVAATSSDTITIVGARAIQRTTDFTTGGDLFANSLNDELDSLTIFSQQVAETAERGIKAPVTDPTSINMTLPSSTARASKALGFTASGNPTQSSSTLAAIDAAVSTVSTLAGASPGSSAGISHIAAGTGAVATTVQAKLRETVSVKDFGAVGDGVIDDAAAIQNALNASDYVEIPDGTYGVTGQVTVAAGKTLRCKGTIIPLVNPGSTTSFFRITGSNVTLDFEGGGMDGLSSTYVNFCGISAGSTSATTRISNVRVLNGTFKNMALTNTNLPSVIGFDGVDYGFIENNKIENCGGFGIYMQYSNFNRVTNNVVSYATYSGINDSAGSGNVIAQNHVEFIGEFGFKGGYGPNQSTVTSDISPTIYTCSIARTDAALRNIKNNTCVSFFNAGGDAPIGYVSSAVDHGTYIELLFSKPLSDVPQNGVQVQLLLTGTLWADNTLNYSSDNGWDINGWANVACIGNVLNNPGVNFPGGGTTYLADGFWFGYDAQGGYNFMKCENLLIEGNTINNAYGSAIAVMGTANNITINGNAIYNANRGSLAGSGAIEVTRLSYHPSYNHHITNNTIVGAVGYGIKNGYARQTKIANNYIKASNGIAVYSMSGTFIENNYVESQDTGVNTYCITVESGGANPSSAVSIKNNTCYGNYGKLIWNQDTSFNLIDVWGNNTLFGTATSFSNNGADVASSESINGAAFVERHTTQYLTGQAITFERAIASTANAYLLSVQSEQSAASGLTGLYFISRSTTQAQITTVAACADVSVTLNGSYQVVVTNTTGNDRTICASLSVIM